jgi:hypothetical protein
MKTRIFKSSDIAMLLAGKIIAKNFLDYITELSKVRTTWTADYASSLITKVDTVTSDLLGKTLKTNLFESTAKLDAMVVPAHKDISSLKIQIDADFKKDAVTYKILKDELGFTAYYKGVTNKTQKEVIGFLNLFARNIDKHKNAIVAKGTPADLIDRITGYSKIVSEANTVQEQLKTLSKDVTANNIEQLNALYEELSTICKIASDYYKQKPAMKELFTFSKILENLGGAKSDAAKAKSKKLKAGEAA